MHGSYVGRRCSWRHLLFSTSALCLPVSLAKTMIEVQTDLNPTEEVACVHPVWAELGIHGCSNFRTILPALGIAGPLYSVCL